MTEVTFVTLFYFIIIFINYDFFHNIAMGSYSQERPSKKFFYVILLSNVFYSSDAKLNFQNHYFSVTWSSEAMKIQHCITGINYI